MYSRVDKTDLIVNSTELCFGPKGYYEIESVGRILRPIEETREDQRVFDVVCREIARKKVSGIVKVFDCYRESTQRHFAQGNMGSK
ncbi:MAG: hypothetical protein HYY56_02380, partial [Candidatus Omnitrophica bacterium]|nr:hypothetical protein [Candidatus Omnitrophota bacterium]